MTADTAFQTQFRTETVKAFEVTQAYLRSTVTNEPTIKGNQATFLVAGSGGAGVVTRGVNGRIASGDSELTQVTATLEEKHRLVTVTGFNVFASQGDRRRIMQDDCVATINREIDANIITALETGTQDTGAATTMSLNLVMKAYTILGNNEVPLDGNIFGLLTPGAFAYLMQTKEFASADFVNDKPFAGGGMTQFRWANVNWIVHPNLSGVSTNAEKCIMYHRNAVGHAMDTAGINTALGYNDEQDYSYARCSVYHNAVKLQNSGIVIINHDGSSFAAS